MSANRWRRALAPGGRAALMQYRPSLLDGFFASTGLDLTPFYNPRN